MNLVAQSRINYLKDNIKHTSRSGSKANLFQYCKNNTEVHEITKFYIFTKLIQADFEVYVEPELTRNMGRPDLLAFSPGGNAFIIEVTNTESKESIEKKKAKYPSDFEFVEINIHDNLNDKLNFI